MEMGELLSVIPKRQTKRGEGIPFPPRGDFLNVKCFPPDILYISGSQNVVEGRGGQQKGYDQIIKKAQR